MSEKPSSKGKNLLQRINEWDHKTFLKLYKNKFLKGKKIILFAKIISFIANMQFWGVIWLIWAIYGYITKDYYLFVLFTGGFIQSIILHIIIRYRIVKRNRPYITLEEKGVKQHDELIREDKSFPSGHVTFLLFFGIIFAFFFQNWIILLIFILLDIGVAITRLILGVHYPTDVLGGFLFGALFAILYLGLTCFYWVNFFYWLGEIFSPIIHFWK